eukprot:CAMPEP_0204270508 /NCGR_PEP_ID=MMETSP0468-20130131/18938_1 /ASSEMBLY_ACC=CAM_ASM_000383 /TAXON_ID=2969 /ORGANISM="Oxyrrhis marina" /LENGTH=187 /DNA_ID=CAMNT_0051246053 /DNA_START=62 /DNA_END=620 /DNA_ORIENTATION=-
MESGRACVVMVTEDLVGGLKLGGMLAGGPSAGCTASSTLPSTTPFFSSCTARFGSRPCRADVMSAEPLPQLVLDRRLCCTQATTRSLGGPPGGTTTGDRTRMAGHWAVKDPGAVLATGGACDQLIPQEDLQKNRHRRLDAVKTALQGADAHGDIERRGLHRTLRGTRRRQHRLPGPRRGQYQGAPLR